ncbi:MAG: TIGR03545 family protein [Gemmatimonadales bacterium]|nr:TIGR03545 family protein [Gemmatimonadales bacterium]
MALIRWKAVLPMALVTALVAVFWLFFLDETVRRLIERQGTAALCAKVELRRFHLTLKGLQVELEGLRVTDPVAPMRNMFELEQAVADLEWPPLLEKKVRVRELAARGMRFGTARPASGAVPDCRQSPPGVVGQLVDDWVRAVPRPSLDLGGLSRLQQLPTLRPDSLATVRQAKAVIALGDSLKRAFEADVRAADPRPTIDTAKALVQQVKAFDPKRLDVAGAARLAQQARGTIQQVQARKRQVDALGRSVETRLDSLRRGVAGLERAKQQDLAFAKSLVQLPSLDMPSVSAALFTDIALERLKPMLYWVNLAEQYVPPGLDPRRRRGPDRLRLAGTTYEFPRAARYPTFLLDLGEATLEVGGVSAASGAYRARVEHASTEPALVGEPLRFLAERTDAAKGPRELRVSATVDRRGATPRDTVAALLDGLQLPSATIAPVGATLGFGTGRVTIGLSRVGDRLAGQWRVDAQGVTWTRTSTVDAAEAARFGTRAWGEALLWRTVSSIRDVTIDARIAGSLAKPELAISSNVGDQVSAGLQRALGAEVAKLEAQLRAEVDRAVQAKLAEARSRLTVLDDAKARLAAQGIELDGLERELDAQVKRLTGGVAPGIRLPKLPGLR